MKKRTINVVCLCLLFLLSSCSRTDNDPVSTYLSRYSCLFSSPEEMGKEEMEEDGKLITETSYLVRTDDEREIPCVVTMRERENKGVKGWLFPDAPEFSDDFGKEIAAWYSVRLEMIDGTVLSREEVIDRIASDVEGLKDIYHEYGVIEVPIVSFQYKTEESIWYFKWGSSKRDGIELKLNTLDEREANSSDD